ncbi:hypothetical protein MPDQ_006938 [Monascus purpureus]|uniref:Uncharacterized protein n=1 Tax=Monascus purpureus TaxID=5098 RepID=A0A507QXG0_MONPU|nr:hypothetical protein MPDQ_006938 [Monascus purpureus]BDD60943.1 hypothetical protein MAP00_006030 [Monascus purpureus]
MHNFRDALLSPSPKDFLEPDERYDALKDQETIRESITQGNLEELRAVAFFNRTWIISSRYCSVGDGVDFLEGYLHSLWYIYYQLSWNTSCETSDHDRIVLDILRIQGMGPGAAE